MGKRKRRGDELVHNTDVIFEVLSRLPVISLLRFKCVSKSWRNLISSEEFVKFHLKRSQETDYDGKVVIFSRSLALHSFDFHNCNSPVTELYCPNIFKVPKGSKISMKELIGSSNGLLCFCVHYKFVLYNPATRYRKVIPEVERKQSFPCDVLAEFAYDCIGDDYKILNISTYFDCPNHEDKGDTRVYSIRANSWKSVEYPSRDLTYRVSQGVVVSNILHLIDYGDKVMRGFDLYTDSFTLGLSLPQEINKSSRLAFLKGDWHLLVDYCDVRIWKKNSWMKLFHFPRNNSLSKSQVLMFDYSKDGKQVLVGATLDSSVETRLIELYLMC